MLVSAWFAPGVRGSAADAALPWLCTALHAKEYPPSVVQAYVTPKTSAVLCTATAEMVTLEARDAALEPNDVAWMAAPKGQVVQTPLPGPPEPTAQGTTGAGGEPTTTGGGRKGGGGGAAPPGPRVVVWGGELSVSEVTADRPPRCKAAESAALPLPVTVTIVEDTVAAALAEATVAASVTSTLLASTLRREPAETLVTAMLLEEMLSCEAMTLTKAVCSAGPNVATE